MISRSRIFEFRAGVWGYLCLLGVLGWGFYDKLELQNLLEEFGGGFGDTIRFLRGVLFSEQGSIL